MVRMQKILCVAPDGVDLEPFQHPESAYQARQRLGLPQDKKIVLYVGRLDGWKGADTLLEASKKLPSDILVAIIGGEREQVARYKRCILRRGFLVIIRIAKLPNNQAAADALVLPNTARDTTSARFTSPLKLFTYMASGKPIVASDLPSLREVISDETAFFVEPDNADALAEGIKEVIDHKEESARRAERARRDVEQYTWEARAKNILAFLASK